jgi:hypothetical protein
MLLSRLRPSPADPSFRRGASIAAPLHLLRYLLDLFFFFLAGLCGRSTGILRPGLPVTITKALYVS